MLKVNPTELDRLEAMYEGLKVQIESFEAMELPNCPNCNSSDTASVQVGIIGRTMNLAGATSKVKLIPNGPRPGKHHCNQCNSFFT